MYRKLNNKKGQLTVFIILALAIVVVLILLFLGRERLTTILTPQSPIEQIKSCVSESFDPAFELIKIQGGSLAPTNYYLYQNNKIDYLCYSEEEYAQCVMQKPFLKQSIEKELETYLLPRVKNCIESTKSSLQDKGYEVSSKNPEINISLVPGSIILEIRADLRIAKDTTESYESIKIDKNSKLYNMIIIASSIINWEARYGDAETMNYMIYYPNLKVEKKKQDEGTTIYTLTDRSNSEKFIFASRSVSLPAGLTGK